MKERKGDKIHMKNKGRKERRSLKNKAILSGTDLEEKVLGVESFDEIRGT